MERHPITWTAPQPLWTEASGSTEAGRAVMSAPAILRFTTDDFMPEFLNVLATDPHRLGEYRVVKETWRGVLDQSLPLTPKKVFALPLQRLAAARQRRNGAANGHGQKSGMVEKLKEAPLKLYQPAHQRFYLVTSCLVCQLAGLPDRKVDPGKHEQAGFIMRRLLPPKLERPDLKAPWIEHAWIEKNGARYWQPVSSGKQGELFETDEGQREEVLPLFSVNHTQDDQRQRRLMAGLIPVGKREAYLAASGGPENPSGGVTSITVRKALLRKEVIEPWKGLITRAADDEKKLTETVDGHRAADDVVAALKARMQQRARIQTASWFILLDLANYLERYVTPVWHSLNGVPPTIPLNPSQNALMTELNETCLDPSTNPLAPTLGSVLPASHFPSGLLVSLRDALRVIKSCAVDLDKVETNLEATYMDNKPRGLWPNFLFPLADPQFPTQAARPRDITLTTLPDPAAAKEEMDELNLLADDLAAVSPQERLDKLAALIIRALDNSEKKPEPTVPLAARQPADALEGWFVIRCVYARPACGPLHEDVVSKPTEPFQLAGFFDPDAPARPIRIGLPIDTTPAGLRKFDRNTAFVISDTLCGQIARLKGITLGDLVRTVLPWPLHKDLDVPDNGPCQKGGASLGMICSLSIPIITICALILLMIMVSILDYVFRWMPYFIMCFPLPGLSAKKPPSTPVTS